MTTTRRHTVNRISSIQQSHPITSRCELDSHADTSALGSNFVPLSFTGRVCDVSPYNAEAYQAEQNIPIVSAATAYTDPFDGQVYILVIHEGLWFGDKLNHSLINPNQLRFAGTTVHDNPFDANNPIAIENEEVTIPLQILGTTIFLETTTPSQHELDNSPHVHLTLDAEWDPQTVQLKAVARAQRSVQAAVQSGDVEPGLVQISSVFCTKEMAENIIKQQHIGAIDVEARKTFVSNERHSAVTSEQLCERWNIGLKHAKQTLKVTTQRGVRSAILPLSRRYRTDRMYNQRKLRGQKFYTDTLIGKYKSLTNNTCAQIFANESYFVKIYPMESKASAGRALRQFVRDFGVPEQLTSDGAAEQSKPNTEFVKNVRRYGIEHHLSEPQRPQQNRAESVIREVKRRWFRQMTKRRVPKRLWDYGIVWVSEVMSLTANSTFALDGRTPMEQITGETPDISEYLDFSFYDWVWYRDNAGVGDNMFGRWLGVSHRVGNLMSYWILTNNGRVISRTTVQRVTNLELSTDEVRKRCVEYDARIADIMKDANHVIQVDADDQDRQLQDWDDYTDIDDPDFAESFNAVVSDPNICDADDDFTPDTVGDEYIDKEIKIELGASGRGDPQYGKVTTRLRDAEGRPIGTANSNPMLDTRKYEVEFRDGKSEALTANLIAQHIYSQIDEEGARHVLLEEIKDHRRTNDAIDKSEAIMVRKNGVKRRRHTTKGWQMLCLWKDGSTNWVALKDVRQSYPVLVAEYAYANKIHDEAAFAWWIGDVIKKRDRILSKVKSKYWERTHKFGIRIPKLVEEALAIDRAEGNNLWWEAICKEMRKVRPACEKWEESEAKIPPGYQKIKCHFIFDIKMSENFRRKARLVANGNETDTPASLTYSSVVSRDSVRIALTIATLNDLEVLACDIENAYLTADCREKIYIIAGPEFGSEAGSVMIIRKALYGLKSSGAAFRAHLAETLYDLSYIPTKADPDVWIRPAVKPNGFEYYEMVLVYVDDILCISHDPKATMAGIQATFKLKDNKVEEPDFYLGARLKKKHCDGIECWTMSASDYVDAAIVNVESALDATGQRLPSKCTTPMQSNYRPELDVTAELKRDGVQYFQELIGVLRWAVELGRIDIALEVSLLSSHLALPREGHLQQVYHIVGFLKQSGARTIVFDPQHPIISESRFVQCDWRDFYRDATEPIPGDAPEPRGNVVSTHCFVDADHAGNRVTRRSQTGVLIFICRAIIMWYSKRQNTVETSTFGSEFIAMRIAVELIEALRYKLRMFGIPIDGPTNVFCDNEAVTKNARLPESTLTKKHNAIAYHRTREAVAAGTIRVAKEDGDTNLADMLTKPLTAARKNKLCDAFMY